MSRAVLERLFPRLRSAGYTITSQIEPQYNCAAFAVGETEEWWDPYAPDGIWPDGIDRDIALSNYELVFERHGFEVCQDGTAEEGFEKIALYADASGDFCHAARQAENGSWLSKLGELEDIEHSTFDAVICPAYGNPVRFMKRRIVKAPSSDAS